MQSKDMLEERLVRHRFHRAVAKSAHLERPQTDQGRRNDAALPSSFFTVIHNRSERAFSARESTLPLRYAAWKRDCLAPKRRHPVRIPPLKLSPIAVNSKSHEKLFFDDKSQSGVTWAETFSNQEPGDQQSSDFESTVAQIALNTHSIDIEAQETLTQIDQAIHGLQEWKVDHAASVQATYDKMVCTLERLDDLKMEDSSQSLEDDAMRSYEQNQLQRQQHELNIEAFIESSRAMHANTADNPASSALSTTKSSSNNHLQELEAELLDMDARNISASRTKEVLKDLLHADATLDLRLVDITNHACELEHMLSRFDTCTIVARLKKNLS